MNARKLRIVGACTALLMTIGGVLVAAPAQAADGSWSASGPCGTQETVTIPAGNYVKVTVAGAPGTAGWGVNGGGGAPGGYGSSMTLVHAPWSTSVTFSAIKGCTSTTNAGGAGWAPGGSSQSGGGAGGGASAVCWAAGTTATACKVGDTISGATLAQTAAVVGGGGGGGGGTCSSQNGWVGGWAGVTPISSGSKFTGSYSNGADGQASPQSGAVVETSFFGVPGAKARGADWNGGQLGGASGGGGGFYGGRAGSTYGGGCQSGGGGGGGASWINAPAWALSNQTTADAAKVTITWQTTPYSL